MKALHDEASLVGSCFSPLTGCGCVAEGEWEQAGGQSRDAVMGQSVSRSKHRVRGVDCRYRVHFSLRFYPEWKPFPFFFPPFCLSLLSLLLPPVLEIALAAAHQPHILPLLPFGESLRFPYLTMEELF